MEYGKKADYNTVWVPLSEENSEVFDETKAWEFIDQHMGIDYGWQNLLTGWLVSNLISIFRKANYILKTLFYHVPEPYFYILKDLNDGNKVCLDQDKTWCLEPEHHLELVFSVADRISEVFYFITVF